MQGQFVDYIYLVLIILGLVMLANRLRIAYPIVLVLGGLALSFLPMFSEIRIDPEMIFFIFLPPLLYEAAWQTSWKEFWRWRRVIMSFAFPIVILTSTVIAFASVAIIPGFTLALGFLLGGIISPPDAISATTIMRQVKVSRTTVSIIEGESLLNDASSLIVFRFALAAVVTGQFHLQDAVGDFFLVITAGTAIGLLVALIFYSIHRWLPTTPSIDIGLTLVAPYCMYYAAEHFHSSGVLAVVAGGLLLSGKRQSMLSYQSRLQSVNVWTSLVFVLNGLVFLLIGLQLPAITSQLDGSVDEAIWCGLAISALLIVTRLLCALGASGFTMVAGRFITVADNNPGWRGPLVIGWAGMRGVVSLAAALSIPLMSDQGHAFPHRNLILFITFIVILVTLVFQGLTLPWVIRWAHPEDRHHPITERKQEMIIQKKIAQYTLQYLEEKHTDKAENEYVQNMQTRLRMDLQLFSQELDEAREQTSLHHLRSYQMLYLELLEHQRSLLLHMNHRAEFDEEVIRKYLSLVDLEEHKLREKLLEEAE